MADDTDISVGKRTKRLEVSLTDLAEGRLIGILAVSCCVQAGKMGHDPDIEIIEYWILLGVSMLL